MQCLTVVSWCTYGLSPGVLRHHGSDGYRIYRMYLQAPLDSVQVILQKFADYASITEGHGEDVELDIRSEEINGLPLEFPRRSTILRLQPRAFRSLLGRPYYRVHGLVLHTMASGNGTYLEDILVDEPFICRGSSSCTSCASCWSA